MAIVDLNKKNKKELREAMKKKQLLRPAGKNAEDLINESIKRREKDLMLAQEIQDAAEQAIIKEQENQQYGGNDNPLRDWQAKRKNEKIDRQKKSVKQNIKDRRLIKRKDILPKNPKLTELSERDKMIKARSEAIQKQINEQRNFAKKLARKRAQQMAKRAAMGAAKKAQLAAQIGRQTAIFAARIAIAAIIALGDIFIIILAVSLLIIIIYVAIDYLCGQNFVTAGVCSGVSTVSGWIDKISGWLN